MNWYDVTVSGVDTTIFQIYADEFYNALPEAVPVIISIIAVIVAVRVSVAIFYYISRF